MMVLFGCASKKPSRVTSKLEGTIAVAAFSQPRHEWEVLGGYYYLKDSSLIGSEVMDKLNALLAQALEQHGLEYDLGPNQVRQCREYVLYKQRVQSMKASQIWARIGNCLSVEYLLIPQIFTWHERKGGEYGVESPAKVVFDLILFDVAKKKVIRTFRFEEEQKALSENILNIFRFFQRKGRWIKAEKLAREGINQGLEELGL